MCRIKVMYIQAAIYEIFVLPKHADLHTSCWACVPPQQVQGLKNHSVGLPLLKCLSYQLYPHLSQPSSHRSEA